MPAHTVGLVDDDQVPLGGGFELVLQLLVACELVHAGDEVAALLEGVAAACSDDHVAGEQIEIEPELLPQLVLPLVGQRSGRDDETALQITAQLQLLDEKPGHDRLARARIVGEQEAHRLTRQQLVVDGGDLMRQRLDEAGGDGDVGIEEPGQVDAVGLGDEPEQLPVPVE